jgi:hypothetical protein
MLQFLPPESARSTSRRSSNILPRFCGAKFLSNVCGGVLVVTLEREAKPDAVFGSEIQLGPLGY